MAKQPEGANEPDLVDLVKGVALDTERLIDQHLELLRSELRAEVDQAKSAALSMGAGTALIATGAILSTVMLVHGLHRASRLPLWSCYGLVGGLIGAVGAGLVATGRNEAAGVNLIPEQTVEAFKENLAWLKEQTNPNPT